MNKETNIRQLLWTVLIVGALFCAGSLLRPDRDGAVVATVTLDNQEVLTVDLQGAEDQEFSILDKTGKDITFQIKDHAIRFLHSDCPDKICVNTGFLRKDGDIATCLPNKVILTVSAQS